MKAKFNDITSRILLTEKILSSDGKTLRFADEFQWFLRDNTVSIAASRKDYPTLMDGYEEHFPREFVAVLKMTTTMVNLYLKKRETFSLYTTVQIDDMALCLCLILYEKKDMLGLLRKIKEFKR